MPERVWIRTSPLYLLIMTSLAAALGADLGHEGGTQDRPKGIGKSQRPETSQKQNDQNQGETKKLGFEPGEHQYFSTFGDKENDAGNIGTLIVQISPHDVDFDNVTERMIELRVITGPGVFGKSTVTSIFIPESAFPLDGGSDKNPGGYQNRMRTLLEPQWDRFTDEPPMAIAKGTTNTDQKVTYQKGVLTADIESKDLKTGKKTSRKVTMHVDPELRNISELHHRITTPTTGLQSFIRDKDVIIGHFRRGSIKKKTP